tara:strand:- start:194 stop:1012 length:819 start_codon:yes stop_codon:yes gene_type:complete
MRQSKNHFVYWRKNRYSGSNFNDLFENDIEVKKIPFLNIYYKGLRILNNAKYRNSVFFYLEKKDVIKNNFSTPLFDTKKNFWYRVNNGVSIDYEYENIPHGLRKEYLSLLNNLIISKKVKLIVEEFIKNNFTDEIVGFQLRTWADENRRAKMFDIQEYKKIANQLDKGVKIFVTSDKYEVINELKKNYKDQIISYSKPDQILSSDENHSNNKDYSINSLVEILLLSKCKTIYGSYLSNFSEMAWWYSGCNAKVHIVNTPTIQDGEIIKNVTG